MEDVEVDCRGAGYYCCCCKDEAYHLVGCNEMSSMVIFGGFVLRNIEVK